MAEGAPGRGFAPLYAALDARPWLRLLLFALAGAVLLLPVQWVAHALAPTTETRAVVTDVVSEPVSEDNDTGNYRVLAVSAEERGLDLTSAGAGVLLAELPVGSPVIVTRSAIDGRILQVRSPTRTVSVENHPGMVVLRLGALVLAGLILALALGVRPGSTPRRPGRPDWPVVALATGVGLLLAAFLATPVADLGTYRGAVPDAMWGYPTPPTAAGAGGSSPVQAVVAIGTPVPTFSGARLTVTGPPEPGLPAGSEPGNAAGFATLRVPLAVAPGPDGPAPTELPGLMRLIGTGRGATVPLDEQPACGGAPQGFPDRFSPPRQGFACFAVPDDFVPRYLVLPVEGVAVALSPGEGAATSSR